MDSSEQEDPVRAACVDDVDHSSSTEASSESESPVAPNPRFAFDEDALFSPFGASNKLSRMKKPVRRLGGESEKVDGNRAQTERKPSESGSPLAATALAREDLRKQLRMVRCTASVSEPIVEVGFFDNALSRSKRPAIEAFLRDLSASAHSTNIDTTVDIAMDTADIQGRQHTQQTQQAQLQQQQHTQQTQLQQQQHTQQTQPAPQAAIPSPQMELSSPPLAPGVQDAGTKAIKADSPSVRLTSTALPKCPAIGGCLPTAIAESLYALLSGDSGLRSRWDRWMIFQGTRVQCFRVYDEDVPVIMQHGSLAANPKNTLNNHLHRALRFKKAADCVDPRFTEWYDPRGDFISPGTPPTPEEIATKMQTGIRIAPPVSAMWYAPVTNEEMRDGGSPSVERLLLSSEFSTMDALPKMKGGSLNASSDGSYLSPGARTELVSCKPDAGIMRPSLSGYAFEERQASSLPHGADSTGCGSPLRNWGLSRGPSRDSPGTTPSRHSAFLRPYSSMTTPVHPSAAESTVTSTLRVRHVPIMTADAALRSIGMLVAGSLSVRRSASGHPIGAGTPHDTPGGSQLSAHADQSLNLNSEDFACVARLFHRAKGERVKVSEFAELHSVKKLTQDMDIVIAALRHCCYYVLVSRDGAFVRRRRAHSSNWRAVAESNKINSSSNNNNNNDNISNSRRSEASQFLQNVLLKTDGSIQGENASSVPSGTLTEANVASDEDEQVNDSVAVAGAVAGTTSNAPRHPATATAYNTDEKTAFLRKSEPNVISRAVHFAGFAVDTYGLAAPALPPPHVILGTPAPTTAAPLSDRHYDIFAKPLLYDCSVYKVELSEATGGVVHEEDASPGHNAIAHGNVRRQPRRCFNCDSVSHDVFDCPEETDSVRVQSARMDFQGGGGFGEQSSSGATGARRYHVPPEYAHMTPGRISSELAAALGIEKGDVPPYVLRMNEFGYPPGYRAERARQLEDEGDSREEEPIAIFGDGGHVIEKKEGSNLSLLKRVDRTDGDGKVRGDNGWESVELYKYPGFNGSARKGHGQSATYGTPAHVTQWRGSALPHWVTPGPAPVQQAYGLPYTPSPNNGSPYSYHAGTYSATASPQLAMYGHLGSMTSTGFQYGMAYGAYPSSHSPAAAMYNTDSISPGHATYYPPPPQNAATAWAQGQRTWILSPPSLPPPLPPLPPLSRLPTFQPPPPSYPPLPADLMPTTTTTTATATAHEEKSTRKRKADSPPSSLHGDAVSKRARLSKPPHDSQLTNSGDKEHADSTASLNERCSSVDSVSLPAHHSNPNAAPLPRDINNDEMDIDDTESQTGGIISVIPASDSVIAATSLNVGSGVKGYSSAGNVFERPDHVREAVDSSVITRDDELVRTHSHPLSKTSLLPAPRFAPPVPPISAPAPVASKVAAAASIPSRSSRAHSPKALRRTPLMRPMMGENTLASSLSRLKEFLRIHAGENMRETATPVNSGDVPLKNVSASVDVAAMETDVHAAEDEAGQSIASTCPPSSTGCDEACDTNQSSATATGTESSGVDIGAPIMVTAANGVPNGDIVGTGTVGAMDVGCDDRAIDSRLHSGVLIASDIRGGDDDARTLARTNNVTGNSNATETAFSGRGYRDLSQLDPMGDNVAGAGAQHASPHPTNDPAPAPAPGASIRRDGDEGVRVRWSDASDGIAVASERVGRWQDIRGLIRARKGGHAD